MSSNYSTIDISDIWLMNILSEANKLEIIDQEWYKSFLNNILEALAFNHFAVPKEIKVESRWNGWDFMAFVERACELLNHEKNLRTKYSVVRTFNVFMMHCKDFKRPIDHLAILSTMTDEEIKRIRNCGPKTFRVLQMTRDLINSEPVPYEQNEVNEWAKSVYKKYKDIRYEEDEHDSDC